MKVSVRKNSSEAKGDQVFVKQGGIKLKKGKDYKISFWIMSRSYEDSVMCRIYSGKDTGSSKKWGAVLDKSFEFTGNGKWQQITCTFTAEAKYDLAVDYKNLALLFGFDKRKGTFFLDDITLDRL